GPNIKAAHHHCLILRQQTVRQADGVAGFVQQSRIKIGKGSDAPRPRGAEQDVTGYGCGTRVIAVAEPTTSQISRRETNISKAGIPLTGTGYSHGRAVIGNQVEVER